jgi:uncharacterized membrane protein YdjX (TVP38/TMEM64 family)
VTRDTAPTPLEKPEKAQAPAGKKTEWHKLGLAIIAVVIIVIIVAVLTQQFSLATMQDKFVEFVARAGAWGWLLLISIMILHAFIPFPMEFAAVAAGATYGFWLGSLLTWVGTLAGGALSFWLARWLGRPFVERNLSGKKRDWLATQSEDKGTIALLVSRFLPFISFTLISYAAGLTRISWWAFLWTTGVGILPVLFLAVFYGSSMSEMPIQMAIGIPVVALLLVLALYMIARKKGWINKSPH